MCKFEINFFIFRIYLLVIIIHFFYYSKLQQTALKMFRKNFLNYNLYQSIKLSNLRKLSEILRNFDVENNEFFDDKITFVSLAVLNGKFFSKF